MVPGDDEFTVIVPRGGLPVLAEPGDDLSVYVGSQFASLRRTYVLKQNRSAVGTILAERELSKDDEIEIEILLNQFLHG